MTAHGEFSAVRTDRLLRLAEHLETGQLGHERFDFDFYNDASDRCGTTGCALGECPIVWPDDWYFHLHKVALRGETSSDVRDSAALWFGCSKDAAEHLFYPSEQLPEFYGGEELGEKATREQVAANIRAFIEVAISEGARRPEEWATGDPAERTNPL